MSKNYEKWPEGMVCNHCGRSDSVRRGPGLCQRCRTRLIKGTPIDAPPRHVGQAIQIGVRDLLNYIGGESTKEENLAHLTPETRARLEGK